jgi:serine/threonine protein phosphatase PrpC
MMARHVLSTADMEIAFAGQTHVGQRRNNEDAFFADPALGLFVVADGMGGYEGGEVASSLAVEAISGFIGSNRRDVEGTWPVREQRKRSFEENLLDAAMVAAHERIVERRAGPLIEMGSTAVASLIVGARMIVAHVGDSRLYRLRRGELSVLTRDHSCWEELRASGWSDEATFPFRNQITRALGVERAFRADVARHPLAEGDTYLLCTDGLYDPLDASDLKTALRLEPQEACASLIARALENGGTDNLTAIVTRIGSALPVGRR